MGLPSAVLLRTQSDDRLVALAREGHERAFEAIVRRYRRPLLSACQRICADGRGEDVLQQALLSAWAALRRGDDVRDLPAWLFRIVRNAAVSHRRRNGHDGAELVDTLSLAASPQEEAERRAVVQETLEAIAGCRSASARRCCGSPCRAAARTRWRAPSASPRWPSANSCTAPARRCGRRPRRWCRCRSSPGR